VRFIGDDALEHLCRVTDEPDLSATKYRLAGEIGRGGMGAVYVAEDGELGREVALKVTTYELGPEIAERLRREARVLARLEHPGIVPVHDFGILPDGRAFYVMKLVRGRRLDAWAREHADRRAALRLFQRVCEAVAFAHAAGVLHRDLKPENVMVGSFGEALVMDWGIAKELARLAPPDAPAGAEPRALPDSMGDTLPASGEQTAAGAVLGTPAYMAPEQARGEIDSLDARADVYGLGAMLYFLLAGRPPFDGDSPRAIVARVLDAPPPPLGADVPAPLAAIAHKALAKEPAARYQTALDLARDVDAWLDGNPVSAHPETTIERAVRLARRHAVLLALLGAYLLVRVLLALAG
jgi:serine/threonine protein kinase